MPQTILITGATGKQGGSVIDNLLQQDADVEILAVTRTANSSSAQKLADKSPKIKLIQGSLDHADDIFATAKKATQSPIWGVFSVQVASFTGNTEIEEQQGKNLVDAALRNNVKHFVYTSCDRGGDNSLNNPTNIPHFINKHNIELHLIDRAKGTDMTWTILRPVAFLDGGLVPGFAGKLWATSIKVALQGKPLQVVAVSDIGFFGAKAFLEQGEYKGKAISLAGDEVAFDELARVFKSVTGRDIPTTWEFVSRFFMWMVADAGLMFRWFHDEGFGADIAALKRVHPGLKDVRAWLETESEWR
ncbi:hypothetical protein ASPVEDRAFT_36713 [Aspergillus versicolor CBS 583.65]|uniref:NmrA-like domain-containing protein n=1 Tax=Aspergillus versicolor CBS 583.65 TaxID=1036611 RepID=A0A1L9P773_ASPVE|nr:uncharacterized protein ASPVEDRAFT_36713 [Aspergillus versicolor CBS 583.65]OJI97293.1 hypothetical protein ASPVEDRAFT_36713 [Aspergillus versicolor CBS 583.65]